MHTPSLKDAEPAGGDTHARADIELREKVKTLRTLPHPVLAGVALGSACALLSRTELLPGHTGFVVAAGSTLFVPLLFVALGRKVELRWDLRSPERLLLALLFAALLGAGIWVSYRSASIGLRAVNSYLWGTLGAGILLIALGMTRGNRAAYLLAMLFGVPLELPFWPLGREELALGRKARWLARFLNEPPRGYNTPGAHLAYGAIAVKRTLKKLCLRRERRDRAIAALEREKKALLQRRNRLSREVSSALLRAQSRAVWLSQQEYAIDQRLAEIDHELLQRRIHVQTEIVQGFRTVFEHVYRAGLVRRADYLTAMAEFDQTNEDNQALLPRGLVRSRVAFSFEYSMFAGRLAMAILFMATFRTPYLLWSAILLVLDLYVVEPVVLKLHIGSLNLLLDVPGHKLSDLRRHIENHTSPDGVFRVPITVPKFSSNPAWSSLDSIIQEVCSAAGLRLEKIEPFALRDGNRDTRVELCGDTALERRVSAQIFCAAIQDELAKNRARFPLATRVVPHGEHVVITIDEEPAKIWEFIGEDASQAFIYLQRNLCALRDTLAHVGPKFVPVFILASNSTDPDVIHYELARIRELQATADEEYRGQVGFLYLLRGGEWYDYNANIERFDPNDKEFKLALARLKQLIIADARSPREYLLASLVKPLDTHNFADTFNRVLNDADFHRLFEGFDFESLPLHLKPCPTTLRLLERAQNSESLPRHELLRLNRELLLTVLPPRIVGGFFKKVGNDIPVQELLVAGKTKPIAYVNRGTSEHVRDPEIPNFVAAWGDFARYTGLRGSTEQIQRALLEGRDLEVESVPELGAVIDDKNDFAPGELEKGLATMLHPENRHITIGVPRINITFPEYSGHTMCSEYVISAQAARESHNTADGQSRARIFDFSSAAYGKWFKRPEPYLAHYLREVLNAAHALSHDFQQSYLVAGATGRLASFSEALYGPNQFRVRAGVARGSSASG